MCSRGRCLTLLVGFYSRHMSLPATATTTRLLIASAPIILHGLGCAQPAGHIPIIWLCLLLASWRCGHGCSSRCRDVMTE